MSGLLIGRFQRKSGMTRDLLEQIVARQPVLDGLPVLANVDFGHTSPCLTLPIGGTAELVSSADVRQPPYHGALIAGSSSATRRSR